MSSLKLYYDFMSQPSRTLFILLKHFNIPFQPVLTQIGKGENKTEEFKKISKLQLLPAVEEDGLPMTESIAILRYLARTRNLPNSFYPQDAKEQFRVDEYLEWHHANIRYFPSMYFVQTFLMPNKFKKPIDETAVAKAEKNMVVCLDGFEKVWLAKKPFIIGNEITAADLWAACEIEQPRVSGYDPRQGRPALTAWIERVREYFNPTYDKAHGPVYKLEQMTKNK